MGSRGRSDSSRPRTADDVRLLEHDGDALLVAERDDRIVGTLIVGWGGWRCHMYRLAVERSARRTRIARDLADAARRRAGHFGAVRLDATVDPDNEPAVTFWEAVGFQLDVDRRWSLLGDLTCKSASPSCLLGGPLSGAQDLARHPYRRRTDRRVASAFDPAFRCRRPPDLGRSVAGWPRDTS